MIDANNIFGRRDFVVVVEHEELPTSLDGEVLLTVKPTYRRVDGENKNELDQIFFEDWGIRG